jgi:hypothetical protein
MQMRTVLVYDTAASALVSCAPHLEKAPMNKRRFLQLLALPLLAAHVSALRAESVSVDAVVRQHGVLVVLPHRGMLPARGCRSLGSFDLR